MLAKLSESLNILEEFSELEQNNERVCMKLCKASEYLVAIFITMLFLQAVRSLRKGQMDDNATLAKPVSKYSEPDRKARHIEKID